MSPSLDQDSNGTPPILAQEVAAPLLAQANSFSTHDVPALCVRVSKACAMLGIGKTMFYALADAGEIETIKVGRATLVTISSLERLVTSRLGK